MKNKKIKLKNTNLRFDYLSAVNFPVLSSDEMNEFIENHGSGEIVIDLNKSLKNKTKKRKQKVF